MKARLSALERTVRDMANAMEFDFLLDPRRKLLSIGYSRLRRPGLDASCYDLLASEARLASFFASPRAMCRRATGFAWAAPLTPVGARHRAAVLVRIDVRISDAVPADA